MRGCEQTRPRARAMAEADHSSIVSHLSSTAVCGRGGAWAFRRGRYDEVMSSQPEPSRVCTRTGYRAVRVVRVCVLGVSAPRMLPKV